MKLVKVNLLVSNKLNSTSGSRKNPELPERDPEQTLILVTELFFEQTDSETGTESLPTYMF